MCGIVGLYLKNPDLRSELGKLFAPMLIEMTDRGPDSAGIAVYHQPASDGFVKITAFHPDPEFDWESVCDKIRTEFNATVKDTHNDSHTVIETDADAASVADLLESLDRRLMIMSAGETIEIYKEMGKPEGGDSQHNAAFAMHQAAAKPPPSSGSPRASRDRRSSLSGLPRRQCYRKRRASLRQSPSS